MMQMTPSYYRIMAGVKSVFAQEFLEGGFIAANWNIDQDLTHDLPDDWREFNHRFIPVYLEALPEKSKISAGLACGMLHTICKGIKQGDIILTPRGNGHYLMGILKKVNWSVSSIHRIQVLSISWQSVKIRRHCLLLS